MTVQSLIEMQLFQIKSTGDVNRSITKLFCCDLLSIAMGRAPADCAWVTVMGNRNMLAVASLADAACVILAEGASLSEEEYAHATAEKITVFQTELPVFDAALILHNCLCL